MCMCVCIEGAIGVISAHNTAWFPATCIIDVSMPMPFCLRPPQATPMENPLCCLCYICVLPAFIAFAASWFSGEAALFGTGRGAPLEVEHFSPCGKQTKVVHRISRVEKTTFWAYEHCQGIFHAHIDFWWQPKPNTNCENENERKVNRKNKAVPRWESPKIWLYLSISFWFKDCTSRKLH